MEQVVQKFASLREMKAAEYRYWQSRPVHERMTAVSEITMSAYAMKERLPNDLIASKLAAGRMRDLADVEEIRESESE